MRRYETLMVLHPELPAAQIRETMDRIRRVVEDMGGEIEEVDEWGVREMAYRIRKLSRGYYVLMTYRSEPQVVTELERNMKIADEFLRFVSVTASAVRPAPGRTAAAEGASPTAATPGESAEATATESQEVQ